MRILFATTRGAGHVGPLVPFAHACVRAGHHVVVAAPRAAEPLIRRAGLDFVPVDDAPDRAAAWAPVFSRDEAPGAAYVIQELFIGLDARAALPGMLVGGRGLAAGPDRARDVRVRVVRRRGAVRRPARHRSGSISTRAPTPTRSCSRSPRPRCEHSGSRTSTPSGARPGRHVQRVRRRAGARPPLPRLQRHPAVASARPRLRQLRLGGTRVAPLPEPLPRRDRGARGLPGPAHDRRPPRPGRARPAAAARPRRALGGAGRGDAARGGRRRSRRVGLDADRARRRRPARARAAVRRRPGERPPRRRRRSGDRGRRRDPARRAPSASCSTTRATSTPRAGSRTRSARCRRSARRSSS